MKAITHEDAAQPSASAAAPARDVSPFARSALCKAMYGALLLAALGAKPAAAFSGPVCESSLPDSLCLTSVMPGLTLESTLADTTEIGSDTWSLKGTVNVVYPNGLRVPLNESSLSVRLGAEPEIRGETALPLASMPMIGEAVEFTRVPRAAIGLVRADALRELVGNPELPLNDATGADGRARDATRPYLVFHMDAGLAFRLKMAGQFDALNAVQFVAPGSVQTTAVLDVFDPYVYFGYSTTGGIDLEDLKREERDDGLIVYEVEDENGEVISTLTHDPAAGTLLERDLASGAVTEYHREGDDFVGRDARGQTVLVAAGPFDLAERERRRENGDDDKNDDRDKDDDKDESDMPIDAIGFSLNGWIPFAAEHVGDMPADIAEFAGQVYLHGEIPMTPTVSIDGDVVTYVGEHGLSQGGNGVVSLGIPGLPDFIDFGIELGNASAALTVSDTAQKVFVSGELDPDTAFLADILPVLPAPGARVQGYVGNDLQNTFLAIEGKMSVGARMIGDALGVDMDDMQLLGARMIVDRHGFEVAGFSQLQISPDIRLNGSVEVYAAMSWTDPSDLTLSLTGNMDIFGVALENVTLEVGSAGVFVNGAFVTPLTHIALDGRITAAGPSLSGSGSIVLDLGAITGSLREAHATLEAAQATVSGLDRDIAAMRDVVRGERAAHDRELEAAKASLATAQRGVNTLNARIASKNRSIASHRRAISAKYRWYRAGNVWQRPGRYSAYLGEKSWRSAAIGGLYGAIGGLKVSLVTATAALDVARASVTAIQDATVITPIDLDPRVAALITARTTAIAALDVAKAPLAGVPSLDATVAADLALSLGTDGLAGTVTADVNGTEALRGRIDFVPVPRACVNVATFGTACTPL